MTDHYATLGVSAAASPNEIRTAYLARIRVAHPDANPELVDGQPSASELTYAYWHLRDAERRIAYDAQRLRSRKGARRPIRGRQPARITSRIRPTDRRRDMRADPLRKRVSATALAAATLGLVLAFSYVEQRAPASARAIVQPGSAPQAAHAALTRRAGDPSIAAAAAEEFRGVLHSAGLDGAQLYGRRCLDELVASPTLPLLDYCLAFDAEGADWEDALLPKESGRRYFSGDGRAARYRTAARRMENGALRETLLGRISVKTEPTP